MSGNGGGNGDGGRHRQWTAAAAVDGDARRRHEQRRRTTAAAATATADDGGDGGRRRERSMTAVRGSGSRRQLRGAAAKMAVMEDNGKDSKRNVAISTFYILHRSFWYGKKNEWVI